METRTVNNPPTATSHDETVRCVLAIELSKKSWIVAVNTPLSDKISRHTVEACDWKELLELIARIRTRVIQALRAIVSGKPFPACPIFTASPIDPDSKVRSAVLGRLCDDLIEA